MIVKYYKELKSSLLLLLGIVFSVFIYFQVSDITMAAYAGTQGDLAVTAMNVADYATLLNAVVDPTC